jgi:hypothetical protein
VLDDVHRRFHVFLPAASGSPVPKFRAYRGWARPGQQQAQTVARPQTVRARVEVQAHVLHLTGGHSGI